MNSDKSPFGLIVLTIIITALIVAVGYWLFRVSEGEGAVENELSGEVSENEDAIKGEGAAVNESESGGQLQDTVIVGRELRDQFDNEEDFEKFLVRLGFKVGADGKLEDSEGVKVDLNYLREQIIEQKGALEVEFGDLDLRMKPMMELGGEVEAEVENEDFGDRTGQMHPDRR